MQRQRQNLQRSLLECTNLKQRQPRCVAYYPYENKNLGILTLFCHVVGCFWVTGNNAVGCYCSSIRVYQKRSTSMIFDLMTVNFDVWPANLSHPHTTTVHSCLLCLRYSLILNKISMASSLAKLEVVRRNRRGVQYVASPKVKVWCTWCTCVTGSDGS